MARRPATRSTVRKPKSPEGMVNGLKTTVINSDTVAELTKLCDESSFKTPKELDMNSNQRMSTMNGCGDSPVSNEQPMEEVDERVRKKRKTEELAASSSFLDSLKSSSKKRLETSTSMGTSMDRLCKQLVQALQSNDEDLLDDVLNDRTPDVITTTTTNIPGEYIEPFLEYLKRRIYTNSSENISHLIWLEKLLQTRLSLLLTLPNTRNELTSLMEALTIRTEVLQKVITLRGMMNLIMSQVSSKPIITPIRDRRALREYNDSSDEDSGDGEMNYEEHDEDDESNNDDQSDENEDEMQQDSEENEVD